VSDLWVNFLSLVFMIAYIPAVLIAGWVLDKYGYRFGMSLGIILTAIGAWVRAGGYNEQTAWVVMLGQTLAALGQPFILNATPIVAANWFPSGERTIATTICSAASPVGAGLGFLLSPMLLPKDTDMTNMLLGEAAISTGLMILPLLFMKSKPPSPPSSSQSQEEEENRDIGMKDTLVNLITDRNFVLLFFVFGFSLGTFNTFATILGEIVQVYGYSSNESGTMGAVVIFLGLVGSGITGVIVDKTRWYKYMLLLSLLCGTASIIWVNYELKENNLSLLITACAFAGFTLTPILPLSFELVCEIVFPIKEAIPSGLLLAMGQIVGIGMTVGVNPLIKDKNMHTICWIMSGFVGAGFILMLGFFGRLRRLEYEASQAKSSTVS